MTTKKLKARYTGNKSVTYRWLGALEGKTVAKAQTAGRVVEDTWSVNPDPRVTAHTIVEIDLPASGMILIDAESASIHGGRTYRAAVVSPDPKASLDWSRAQWLALEERGEKDARRLFHIVSVDGARREYEVQS